MTDHTAPVQAADERYNRILVPLDGSDASRAALTYATHIPCRELMLLHVSVDDEVLVPEWATDWADADEEDASLDTVLEYVASDLRTAERNVIVETRLGDVAEEIIEAGRDADLVVMMTHGRGAAGRMIFGSIADRVVRHGQTPTLLLRIGELTREPRAPKRIAIALDGSDLAEQAMPEAARLARIGNLPLVLLRAVGDDEIRQAARPHRIEGAPPHEQSPTLYQDTHDAVMREAADYLEEHAATLREQGIEVETQVLDGTAVFALMRAVDAEDILVLTTRGQGGFKRWSIGSVAEKLVREAPCPVLLNRVVRGDGED